MMKYLKEWWTQPYVGTEFQKHQLGRYKSRMKGLLWMVILLILFTFVMLLETEFNISESLGISCESIYTEEKCKNK